MTRTTNRAPFLAESTAAGWVPEFAHGHRVGLLAVTDPEEPEYTGDQEVLPVGTLLVDAEVMTSWTGDRTEPPATTATDWSALADLPETFHRPVLDIDFPMAIVPSTTPGHGHLYLDKVLTWSQYVKLLEVLAEVGILEDGYVQASIAREFTSVRLPWVKKPARPDMSECSDPGCTYPEPHGHGFVCNADCGTCKEWLAKEAAAPNTEQES